MGGGHGPGPARSGALLCCGVAIPLRFAGGASKPAHRPAATGRGTCPPGPPRTSVTTSASTHHQQRPRSAAVTSRPQCATGPAGSSTCRPAPPARYRSRRGSASRSVHTAGSGRDRAGGGAAAACRPLLRIEDAGPLGPQAGLELHHPQQRAEQPIRHP